MEYFPQIRICPNRVQYFSASMLWNTLQYWGMFSANSARVAEWYFMGDGHPMCAKKILGMKNYPWFFEIWMFSMDMYRYHGGKMCDTQEKSSDTGLLACLLALPILLPRYSLWGMGSTKVGLGGVSRQTFIFPPLKISHFLILFWNELASGLTRHL